jgi:hypothetical protein
MKHQRLIQVFVALLVVAAVLAGITQAQAETTASAVVVVRDLTYWDATYAGYVAESRYEKWPILFTDAENFTVTAEPNAEGFSPLVILLDGDGNEIARGTRTLTSSQPAGSYFVMIQPETGAGFYALTIRRVEVEPPVDDDPAVAATVDPASVLLGQAAVVTVSLSNVPAEGYTSAEFTCTYDPAFIAVTGITTTELFGADAAVAIKDPLTTFIVAIAGSNGDKATTSGAAFTFTATGLQAGETAIDCQARVSKGDNVLTQLPATAATLTITEEIVPVDGTLTGQVFAGKSVTVSLYNAENTLVASAEAAADGTFSLTAPAGSYTVMASASGYLSALGSATIVAGETATKPAVTLLAGDIDGNDVIDQFDAMTIGMSYNTAEPTAADLNNDGVINVLDLEILAANYRQAGPINWE